MGGTSRPESTSSNFRLRMISALRLSRRRSVVHYGPHCYPNYEVLTYSNSDENNQGRSAPVDPEVMRQEGWVSARRIPKPEYVYEQP